MVKSATSAMSETHLWRKIIWSLLAVTYLTIRFFFTERLDALGPYASYFFELALVGISIFLAGRSFLSFFQVQRRTLFAALGSFAFGFCIYRAAGVAHIQIPFDLQGVETLFFLLLVAPILEELLFRFFLWHPAETLVKKPALTWILTSMVFSYSHFHALFFVPQEIHPFIIYQTAYTLLLGLWCGYSVLKSKSLAESMLIHFAFNLGFYLGS